jgi:hypothetical protein
MSDRKMSGAVFILIMLSLFLTRLSAMAGELNGASSTAAATNQSAITPAHNVPAMKITIKVAGKKLQATLADNPTAREFAALLPIRVAMRDLFGREKAGRLPKRISAGGPSSDVYKVGDIGYWSPSHDIAIYYHQDGERIPSPGIINIGHIDSGIEAFNVPGTVDISIERSL